MDTPTMERSKGSLGSSGAGAMKDSLGQTRAGSSAPIRAAGSGKGVIGSDHLGGYDKGSLDRHQEKVSAVGKPIN